VADKVMAEGTDRVLVGKQIGAYQITALLGVGGMGEVYQAEDTAIALNPNYVNAHHWYSHYLNSMGRFDESLAASQRALALDPLDVGMTFHLGFHYYNARQYDQAVAQLQRALEMNRNHSVVHHILGLVYEQQGRYQDYLLRSRSF
jgi:tetratricopeptide (TPR) repeat protein